VLNIAIQANRHFLTDARSSPAFPLIMALF